MTKADKEGQRKTPVLRFKGFTDDWEQRELNKTNDVRDGTHDTPKYIDSGYPLITSKNLTSSGTINFDDISYISEDDFNFINKRSNVDTNDILFGMIGTIGNPVLVGNDTNFAIKNVALIKKSDSINQYFLINILNSNIFKKYIIKTNQGNTQKFISLSQIRKFTFYAPQLYEQIEIGKILQKIDSVITLYERKIKALKKLKQAIFEVLNSIPHKSNVYRISEIFDVTRGNVLSKKSISNKFSNMYPVYSSQTKNDGLLGYYSDYLFENSITWTTDGANAGTVKYRTGKFYCTNVCGVLLNSEGYCNEYTAEVIEKETPKFVSHVGNPKLMNNVMKQIKIKLPDVATQQSYSDILLTFDNVCTSFCNKLNDLNQIKNKLLNTMFI